MSNTNRQVGYYWVKKHERIGWGVEYYNGEYWSEYRDVKDGDWVEINETRILAPDEMDELKAYAETGKIYQIPAGKRFEDMYNVSGGSTDIPPHTGDKFSDTYRPHILDETE